MHIPGFHGLRRLSALTPLMLLNGCGWSILDPHGPIGIENRSVILWATLLMLIVVIPVIALTIFFAWRYRASNTAADYAPDWSHSNLIEVVIWTVPALIVAALAVIAWNTSHSLDPYRPIESEAKPVEVQVVALDWKWLFIYPEYHVATVNELAVPVGRPVNFKITSATVMNSFFIPRLGSQVYAMAGMQTKLHLVADRPGTYEGISANYSGEGFSDMKFSTVALDDAGFARWVEKTKAAPAALRLADYQTLAKPSERDPVRYFGSVDPHLYQAILSQNVAVAHEEHTAMNTLPAHQE
ncbi:ubiquinol oxidase subunit II [Sphingomonas oleivorans]|uniref:Ubiquinol oxidase subunit 2 n=1 Tax=Sphingomonas oleivorans TaxID=1735121 RepID=A0A2T5G375_9SPHN|nr:ubiquinol oxidase subunit II [Sphingomonas oleivorans]PTQ13598.1 ubiquinol oxidase subunit II [Sphingomonas oleivorans]